MFGFRGVSAHRAFAVSGLGIASVSAIVSYGIVTVSFVAAGQYAMR